MDLVVPAGSKFDAGSCCRFLVPADSPDVAVIDLGGVTWVEPYAFVATAIFAENQALLRRKLLLRRPRDQNIANYVSRMGMGDYLEALGGRHDLPVVRHRELGSRLVEVRKFTGEEQIGVLAQLVFERLEGRSATIAAAMHQSILEVGANVEDHSTAKNGVVAAQLTHGGRRIAFAIGDSGVGILSTLRHQGFSSDADAIKASLQEGVSSTGERGRGRGLFATRNLVTAAGGTVLLESGTARRLQSLRYGRTEESTTSKLAGTILQAEVRC